MSDDLVQRLRNLVSLNEPRHGGPYMGTAAVKCVEAMAEAADEIERLRSLLQSLADEGATVHGFHISGLPRVQAEIRDDGREEVRRMALRHEAHAWIRAFGGAVPPSEIAEEVAAIREEGHAHGPHAYKNPLGSRTGPCVTCGAERDDVLHNRKRLYSDVSLMDVTDT